MRNYSNHEIAQSMGLSKNEVEALAYYHVLSGDLLSFTQPNPDQINIGYMAKQISGLNRYNNGLVMPISVAEHCCIVYHLVQADGHSLEMQLLALLHDASEAFLGDIVAPLKDVLKKNVPWFNMIFTNWDLAIYNHFGLIVTQDMLDVLKKYDHLACQMEIEYNIDCKAHKIEPRHAVHFTHYDADMAEDVWQINVMNTYFSIRKQIINQAVKEGLSNDNF